MKPYSTIFLDHEKAQIAQYDANVAEEFQNAEVSRFVDLKQKEFDGQQLAQELFEEEQNEFRKAEEEAKRRERRARRDEEKAKQLQEAELERFKGILSYLKI